MVVVYRNSIAIGRDAKVRAAGIERRQRQRRFLLAVDGCLRRVRPFTHLGRMAGCIAIIETAHPLVETVSVRVSTALVHKADIIAPFESRQCDPHIASPPPRSRNK